MRSQDWKDAAPQTRKRGPTSWVRCSKGHKVTAVGDVDLRTADFVQRKCPECGEFVRVPKASS